MGYDPKTSVAKEREIINESLTLSTALRSPNHLEEVDQRTSVNISNENEYLQLLTQNQSNTKVLGLDPG